MRVLLLVISLLALCACQPPRDRYPVPSQKPWAPWKPAVEVTEPPQGLTFGAAHRLGHIPAAELPLDGCDVYEFARFSDSKYVVVCASNAKVEVR